MGTTRSSASEASLRAGGLLETVLAASPAAIAVLRGPRFLYELINPAYEVFGPGRAKLGRSYAECWPDAAPSIVPVMEQVAATGEPFSTSEVRLELARDGTGPLEERFFSYTMQRLPQDERGEWGLLVTAIETTDQVRSRRAAVAGEQKLQYALDAANVGLWEWDLVNDENTWSDSLWALYGLEKTGQRPSGELWRSALIEDDRDRAVAQVSEASARGVEFAVEYRVRTRQGGTRWLASRGGPVRDANGTVTRFRGVVFDITEMKLAALAAERRTAAEALQEALDQLPVGVLVVALDPQGETRHPVFNAAFTRLMGEETVPGQTFADFRIQIFQPDRVTEIPPLELPAQRAALTGAPSPQQQLHIRRRDGSWLVVAVSASPLPPDGTFKRAVAVMLDVTQQHDAIAALRDSEARFRAVIERSSDLILVTTADGTITFASPAAKQVLGYEPGQLVGRNSLDFSPPEDRARVQQAFTEALQRPGQVVRIERRMRRADGTWALVESERRNLLEEPGVRGIVVNNRDVTEAARLRQEFLQAQKLESIGRLAGGVAHDFNNLLTVILSGTETALGEAQGNALLVEELEQVEAAAQRATELTRQLLAFSRRQLLAPRRLDLNGVVKGVERMLQRLIGEDITLSLRLASDLAAVEVDPGQLEQVIVNLVVNARDAMSHGGKLVLRTAAEHLSKDAGYRGPLADGDYVVLEVIDTGTGMDEATLGRIFEPFFTTKDPGKGTGLGLPTAFGIVKQSGGDLEVRSWLGEGSTFRVLLPVAGRADASVRELKDPVRRAKPGETVLVVEDDEPLRRLAARMLENAGYRVLTANSAEAALTLLRETPALVHLVLSDIVMPGAGGVELAKAVHARDPGIRIVLMTGYTDDELVRQGGLPPGVTLFQKPFGPDSLLRLVREALDREHAAG